MKKRYRKIIGSRELLNFPELDLFEIEGKIDTGAFTSAIHCSSVNRFMRDNTEMVSFCLLDPAHPQYNNRQFECPVYNTRKIKNSFGQEEERYTIMTILEFYNESYEVELSLADRSLMEYPILLGRKALRKRFLVDVSKINYAPKQKICILK